MTALTMAETAARVLLSYDRFRKVWRCWETDMGFPAPFNRLPRRRVELKWDAAAIDAWIAARSRAGLTPHPATADAANATRADMAARRIDPAVLAGQRRQLQQLMKGA